MQKRLCRRPEIFNDESIHYRIRSLCFCCHEMYTFIISPHRAQSIVPHLQTTLNGEFIKRKNNKHTHKYSGPMQTCMQAHIPTSPRTTHCALLQHTHIIKMFYSTSLISSLPLHRGNGTVCVLFALFFSHPHQRLNQIYEPVMKHFMLIVFVYEQINGSRAKRMMM